MSQTAENKNGYLVKVLCEDLEMGMYVQELDRPWTETPFVFQGFLLRSPREIEALRKYCKFVYVNKQESAIDVRIEHARPQPPGESETIVREIAEKPAEKTHYEDAVTVEEELKTAKGTYEQGYNVIADVFSSVEDNGAINIEEVKGATTGVVDSVLRNPDAFMLLQHIKKKSEYRYTHAINCCSLSAVFCRHLGFSKQEIHDISMGALLLDIGTIKLPKELLDRPGKLNALSTRLVRHHVNFGLDVVGKTPNVSKIAIEMVQTHHERVNGSGYPAGLKGDQIPMCGRIASIVDSYDAMVSTRPYKPAISPTEAVCSMYNLRDSLFHAELVEQFIQCIGAYPTGSLVRLSSGQIAIVMSQNRTRRLYPRILLIRDEHGNDYETPYMLDLWEHASKTKTDPLDIDKVLEVEEVDIDPAEYYL